MTHHWKTLLPLGTLTVLGLGLAGAAGCDAVKRAAGAIAPPGAEFVRVDLIESPSARELARWGCHEFLGTTPCEAAELNPIQKSKLLFAFDVVFDLSNENSKIPIPLVEILLATTVYESENLGAVCISFCDPDAEDCTPEANAEGACDAENAEEVTTPADLIPTVEELTEIATDIATGDFDNGEFRVIPAGSSIESHIIFDFNIDTMLSLSEHILLDLGEDLLAGRPLEAEIPYTMDGTLFFTVPEMGRFGIGFGPVENTWEI
jgi:hypothetical protein